MPDINLNTFQKHLEAFKSLVQTTGDTKIDEQTFQEKITNNQSIFHLLDQNRDRKISEDEISTVLEADSNNDGVVTTNELACINQMKFFAKRGIDKWFSIDINRDGYSSNVENKTWGEFRSNESYQGLNASMTNEQLAKLYDMEEIIDNKNFTLQSWLDSEIDDLIQDAKNIIKTQIIIKNNTNN